MTFIYLILWYSAMGCDKFLRNSDTFDHKICFRDIYIIMGNAWININMIRVIILLSLLLLLYCDFCGLGKRHC